MKGVQMSFDDPIIAEIEHGLRYRCAGMTTTGKRCKQQAPAWIRMGDLTGPWFCWRHK
jgi:hypothetical protein